MNFLNTNKIIIFGLVIVLIISLVLNFLFYKGLQINIDKSITTHQHQEQYQFQGQLLINQWAAQGNTIVWKTKQCDAKFIQIELNNMDPISAFYAKLIFDNETHQYTLIYPEIFDQYEIKNKNAKQK